MDERGYGSSQGVSVASLVNSGRSAYGLAPQAVERDMTTLELIERRLSAIAQNTGQLAARLANSADRALGPILQPAAASGGVAQTANQSAAMRIIELLTEIDGGVAFAHEQAVRIESIA